MHLSLSTKVEPAYLENLLTIRINQFASQLFPGEPFSPPPLPKDYHWYLSTESVPGFPVGSFLAKETFFQISMVIFCPIVVGLPVEFEHLQNPESSEVVQLDEKDPLSS